MSETTGNFTDNKRNITKEKNRKNSKETHSETELEQINRIIDRERTFQETRDQWIG